MHVEILQEKGSLKAIIVLTYYLLVYSVKFSLREELDFYFMKAVFLDELLDALFDTGIQISLRFSPFYFSSMN